VRERRFCVDVVLACSNMSGMSEHQSESKRLLKLREQEASSLPPLSEMVRGSLLTRYRRCGNPTCHCARDQGHGPAHYLQVTLRPGKTEQILLSEEMLPVARRWVENYQRWWDALEKVSEVNRRLLRLRAAELIGSKEGARKTSSTGKRQTRARDSGRNHAGNKVKGRKDE